MGEKDRGARRGKDGGIGGETKRVCGQTQEMI